MTLNYENWENRLETNDGNDKFLGCKYNGELDLWYNEKNENVVPNLKKEDTSKNIDEKNNQDDINRKQ